MGAHVSRKRTGREKAMAVLAGGLILGLGGALTFAAWVDEEWVFGGTDGDGSNPGIGTSTFEVQQNTTKPYDSALLNWVDEEENPGGELIFGLDALALSPGDVIYAPVALSTTSDSIAGTLALQDAVEAAGGDTSDAALWAALEVSVKALVTEDVTDAVPTADATGWADEDWTTILDAGVNGAGLDAGTPTGGQALEAAHGNAVHYLFRIELPEDAPVTLEGMIVEPAWQFIATSE